jgi:hypothetical protein
MLRNDGDLALLSLAHRQHGLRTDVSFDASEHRDFCNGEDAIP